MTIGENIKRIRTQRNLTQEQLSSLIGISKSMLESYEHNILKPEPKQLEIIAHALNVNSNVLLESEFDNIAAMHRLFQLFRQYDGYFDTSGHIVFRKLHLSSWRNRWEKYQEELKEAENIKNKQEHISAIKNAERDFNLWMDIFPQSDMYNRSQNNDF